jgi:hypothetical protein
MNRTETYTGPWPRKRHSHTCVACKRGRDQGAVYCYKSRCALPQQTESCECCRPLQPSVTHRPPAAPENDGGRTRIGNTPTCEDCGESLDHCTCEDEPPAPAAEPIAQLRSVSDFGQWAENLITREVEDLESLELPDGISIDKWGAALLRRGWAWSDEKSRYEKGVWFVWFMAAPGKPVCAILNRMPAPPVPIIDDVCEDEPENFGLVSTVAEVLEDIRLDDGRRAVRLVGVQLDLFGGAR